MSPFDLPELMEHLMRFAADDTLRALRGVARRWRDAADAELERRGAGRAQSARHAVATVRTLAMSGMLRKTHPADVLWYACRHGSLTVARWVAARYMMLHAEIKASKSLEVACEYNHIAVARWLVCKCSCTCRELFSLWRSGELIMGHCQMCEHCKKDPVSMMVQACSRGHYAFAKWVLDTYFDTDDTTHANLFMHKTCHQGDVKTAQLLVERFSEHFAADESKLVEFVTESCAYGHAEFADWLSTQFDIPPSRIFQGGFHIVLGACGSASKDAVLWVLGMAARAGLRMPAETLETIMFEACMWVGSSTDVVKTLADELGTHLRPEHIGHVILEQLDNTDMVMWALDQGVVEEPPEVWQRIMFDGCRLGRTHILDTIRMRTGMSSWGDSVTPVQVESLLVYACEIGNLQMVQWLIYELNIGYNNVRRCCKINHDKDFFSVACLSGHLDIVMWVAEAFDDFAEDMVTSHTFKQIAENGRDRVVQWLLKNVIARNLCDIFINVCCSGNVNVVRYMVETFELVDLLPPDTKACQIVIEVACTCPLVAKWLLIHCKPMRNLETRTDAMVTACKFMDLDLAKWIWRYFRIPPEYLFPGATCNYDGYVEDLDVLMVACKRGMTDMVKWLCGFGLRIWPERYAIAAQKHGHLDIAKLLRNL